MQFHILPWSALLTIAGQFVVGKAWMIHQSSGRTTTSRQQRGPPLFPVWRQSFLSSSSPSSPTSSSSDHQLQVEPQPAQEEGDDVLSVPDFVVSPVLRQVYPHMIAYQNMHGHVNIPLGSTAGRQCQTLRRLQLQQKLTPPEVDLLTQLNFRFTTLDDIYFQVPFDEMFQRLLDYEQREQTGFQIPKKYPPDPELGAWVTGLRRLTPHHQPPPSSSSQSEEEVVVAQEDEDSFEHQNVAATTTTTQRQPPRIRPDHVERLDAIGFAWTSERKCGSRFMQFYRDLLQRIEQVTDELEDETLQTKARHDILKELSVQAWIAAQRDTFHRGTMSETRQHYMTTLVGDESWKDKTNS